MKITVVGGGSTYTPELVVGFLERVKVLPVKELCLMDIDRQRLEIVGGFVKRIVERNGLPFQVTMTDDLEEGVRGASYVITQLRVGMMPARREDEYLGKRHNLIGQETTGVGGMAKALRTVPVILNVAKMIKKVAAPGAVLFNFTNPSGLVTEALSRYVPDVSSVGVCNVAITAKMMLLEQLEEQMGQKIDPNRAELKTLGLNHLSWHRGFTLDGEDLWPSIMEKFIEGNQEEKEWEDEFLRSLNMIPNYYLQYFYNTRHKLEEQEKWPPSRAEEVMKIEADLLKQYADPLNVKPPADLMRRGGAFYSTLATQLIVSHYNNLGETQIVNLPNRGAVSGYPKDWVLEMPVKVDAKGFHPLPTDPLPLVCFGLLAQVKTYELLTVEAAVWGDRRAAFEALLAHPLGPKDGEVQKVLDDMLEVNRKYLPQFWE